MLQKNIRSILNQVAGKLPLQPLIHLSGKKIFLPFYHTVSPTHLAHINHLYNVKSEAVFEKELDFILKYFQPIGIDELVNITNGKKALKKNSFFISFDDGLSQVFDIIAPILLKKGVPATFFINSAFIDNSDLFFRYKASLLIEKISKGDIGNATIMTANKLLSNSPVRKPNLKEAILHVNYSKRHLLDNVAHLFELNFNEYLNTVKPYLTYNQCLDLKKNGFEFGGHSIDHPLYAELPLYEQIYQTTESIKWVIDNNLSTNKLFAFPFTDHLVSKQFFNKIYLAEQPLADLSFGTAGLKKERFHKHLQRFAMEGNEDAFEISIKGEYLYYLIKKVIHKNKIIRE